MNDAGCRGQEARMASSRLIVHVADIGADMLDRKWSVAVGFDRYARDLIRRKAAEGKRCVILGDRETDVADKASLRVIKRINVAFMRDNEYRRWKRQQGESADGE